MSQRYRLIYEPSEGWPLTEWDKTADELLTTQGDGTLLEYMLREADKRGLSIRLESYVTEPAALTSPGDEQ